MVRKFSELVLLTACQLCNSIRRGNHHKVLKLTNWQNAKIHVGHLLPSVMIQYLHVKFQIIKGVYYFNSSWAHYHFKFN